MEAIKRLNENGYTDLTAYAKYARLVKQHSAIAALDDAFWLAGWVFAGLAVIVWLAEPLGFSGALGIRLRALAILPREEV